MDIAHQEFSGSGMTPWRDAILSRLDAYCEFDVVASAHHLVVSCRNTESFDVSFHDLGGEFQVAFDGWHEHFEAEADALNCFAFGLSDACRLKVVKRGATECSWTVQCQQGETWIDDSSTSLMFIPVWRRKTLVYRRNRLKKKR
ncbi:hypothetical protein ACQ5SO_01465 [Rhodovulum sp. DZ06]|uniref:hypothetical protein n=1 Tax=Rhodovulum sp. DZ06 TaxID=3425126 RepID=UPI003D33A332